jgi:signal transduction histidine kinase
VTVRGERTGFRLMIAGVLATVGVVVFALIVLWMGESASHAAIEAERVRGLAKQVLVSAIDAETAQRGYLLTGDKVYYINYQAASWDASLDELMRSTRGRYDAEVAAITRSLAVKRAEMTSAITQYDAGDHVGAFRLVSSERGKQVMDAARDALRHIVDGEDVRIVSGHHSLQRITSVATVATLAGGSLTVLALAVGIAWMRKRTQQLAELAAAHAAQSAKLEEQSSALGQGVVMLAASNRALASSNRDLDQFAYVASHDLKAPLRAISSLSTWIEEDLGDRTDARIKEHLRLMQTRVHRMEHLIEGILDYARAGRDLEPEDVDVRQLLDAVREQLTVPPGARIEILPGSWPVLRTARVPLQQVWSNLVSNALKYGVANGGTVQLGYTRPAEPSAPWTFWVKDDGPGIEPAYQERIFELFQRLTSRDRIEGAGIGLSIVRKLVDRHGGKVWVESRGAGGATFYFTWSPK